MYADGSRRASLARTAEGGPLSLRDSGTGLNEPPAPLLSLPELSRPFPPLTALAERRHPQETGALPASRARPKPPSADWARLPRVCRAKTEGVRGADLRGSDRGSARAPYQVPASLPARDQSERRRRPGK